MPKYGHYDNHPIGGMHIDDHEPRSAGAVETQLGNMAILVAPVVWNPDQSRWERMAQPLVEVGGDVVANFDEVEGLLTAIRLRLSYEYMGSKTSGSYKYLGFKEKGGTNWKIARIDTTDDSAWKYAYGSSGWTSAWSDPTALSYADPPDA